MQCLVKSEPKISPLSMVRKLKQQSTLRLWQMDEADRRRGNAGKNEPLARDGYVCCTIGDTSQETIRSYIQGFAPHAFSAHLEKEIACYYSGSQGVSLFAIDATGMRQI